MSWTVRYILTCHTVGPSVGGAHSCHTPVSACLQVRSLQSLVTEKTSCITLLQRELDHKQASLAAAQEKMDALMERTNTTISNLQVRMYLTYIQSIS